MARSLDSDGPTKPTPRKRATSSRAKTATKTAAKKAPAKKAVAKKRAPRKRAVKKVAPPPAPESVTENTRKAPTPIARGKANQTARRNQVLIVTTVSATWGR